MISFQRYMTVGSITLGVLALLGAGIPTASAQDNRYVNVSGDTMTGALIINLTGTGGSFSPSLVWEGTASGSAMRVLNDAIIGKKLAVGKSFATYALDLHSTSMKLANFNGTATAGYIELTENNGTRGQIGYGDAGMIFLNALPDSLAIKAISVLHLGTVGGNAVLTVNGSNVGVGKTAPTTKLDVLGTISGSSLTISGLKNCDTLDTNANGALVCGSDASDGGVGGLSVVEGDARYVNTAGDTMTGALTIARPGKNEFLRLNDTTTSKTVTMRTGSGSPEGLVTAEPSSLYFDQRGDVYKKSYGTGNTGWMPLASTSTPLHMAKLIRAAAQSIPNGSTTKIAFDAEEFDIGNIGDSATSDRFVIAKSGKYLVSLSLRVPGLDANQSTTLSLYKNGTPLRAQTQYGHGSNGSPGLSITTTLSLAAGDYLEMYIAQSSGGAQNTDTATQKPEMSVVELSN